MKMIRNTLLIGLTALAVATTRAQDNDAVKNDMAQGVEKGSVLSIDK
jgi:hypothetical protein